MATNRIEALRAMLAQDGNNTFARYGLAMELVNSGEGAQAVDEFRALIATDPDYAAAYYHAGRTLENLGRIDEARAVLEQGIAVTARTGDAHTRSELQAALDLLGV